MDFLNRPRHRSITSSSPSCFHKKGESFKLLLFHLCFGNEDSERKIDTSSKMKTELNWLLHLSWEIFILKKILRKTLWNLYSWRWELGKYGIKMMPFLHLTDSLKFLNSLKFPLNKQDKTKMKHILKCAYLLRNYFLHGQFGLLRKTLIDGSEVWLEDDSY